MDLPNMSQGPQYLPVMLALNGAGVGGAHLVMLGYDLSKLPFSSFLGTFP